MRSGLALSVLLMSTRGHWKGPWGPNLVWDLIYVDEHWFDFRAYSIYRWCGDIEHIKFHVPALYLVQSLTYTRPIDFGLSITLTSQWRDGVSNHQHHGCLFNRLLRRRSKETSKLCVTGLCAGNSPVTGEFPAQMEVTRKMFAFDDVIMFPTKVALPLGILRGILTIGPLICLSIVPLHRPEMGWLKCNSSIIPLRIYPILKNLIRWIAFIFNKCQAAVVPIKNERDT